MNKNDLLRLFQEYYEDFNHEYDPEEVISTFKQNYNYDIEEDTDETFDYINSQVNVETISQEDILPNASFIKFTYMIQNPLYKGLGMDKKRILYSNDLRTLNDFKQLNTNKVLKIKGIGKKTIEVLENNGVTFNSS